VSLFVDTSIWYAAADASDNADSRARKILSSREPLVTTDHVLVETWTLLRNRIHRAAAERFWQGLIAGAVMLEPVGMTDIEAAWQIGLAYPDQDFSLVDRTSFAVMQRLGLDRAASLDEHFTVVASGRGARRHSRCCAEDAWQSESKCAWEHPSLLPCADYVLQVIVRRVSCEFAIIPENIPSATKAAIISLPSKRPEASSSPSPRPPRYA
jgi:predicted nucleic acid-binding protein